MDDNIAIWTITWTITCYSTANSKGEYTAAQSQSIKISRRPITGLCCFCREVEEFGLKRTFLFFLKTSHTPLRNSIQNIIVIAAFTFPDVLYSIYNYTV